MAETIIRKKYNFAGYEQKVHYLLESKEIYFIDCTCPNFTGIVVDKNGKPKWIGSRRVYKSGLYSDQKFYANPCKHLQPIITCAEMQGLTLRKPKPMEGTDRCTAELRRFLIERSGGICEMYMCEKTGIEVHRKVPKTNGGKYNKDNCVLLCPECHKRITYQKWQGSPGAKK